MSVLPFVFFEGKVQPLAESKISIASNSLQYGTITFAGIRGYHENGTLRIFRLHDHYVRFMNSSKIMGFNYFIDYERFESAIKELVRKNEINDDFYIRPFLFSKDMHLGPRPTNLTYELAIFCVSMEHYFNPKGMKLMISSWRKFSDFSFSTKAKAGGCYVNSFLATAEALRCGYDEALLADPEGGIVEASVANILVSYRDRLITPPVGSAELDGITLRTMVELLEKENIHVNFEKIDRSMIYSCDELMLLGTAAQVSFAISVDGRPLGNIEEPENASPGPICQLLREKFSDIVRGKNPNYAHWLTVI